MDRRTELSWVHNIICIFEEDGRWVHHIIKGADMLDELLLHLSENKPKGTIFYAGIEDRGDYPEHIRVEALGYTQEEEEE